MDLAVALSTWIGPKPAPDARGRPCRWAIRGDDPCHDYHQRRRGWSGSVEIWTGVTFSHRASTDVLSGGEALQRRGGAHDVKMSEADVCTRSTPALPRDASSQAVRRSHLTAVSGGRRTHDQFVRFLLVGAAATLIDFALFIGLANTLGLPNGRVWLAKIASGTVGLAMSFYLNRTWTFAAVSHRLAPAGRQVRRCNAGRRLWDPDRIDAPLHDRLRRAGSRPVRTLRARRAPRRAARFLHASSRNQNRSLRSCDSYIGHVRLHWIQVLGVSPRLGPRVAR